MSELFEVREQTLNAMAFSVQAPVAVRPECTIGMGWNHRNHSGVGDGMTEMSGVMSHVGNHVARAQTGSQT